MLGEGFENAMTKHPVRWVNELTIRALRCYDLMHKSTSCGTNPMLITRHQVFTTPLVNLATSHPAPMPPVSRSRSPLRLSPHLRSPAGWGCHASGRDRLGDRIETGAERSHRRMHTERLAPASFSSHAIERR
jgi:hypothetical protein